MSLWQEMQGQRIRSLKTVCLLFGWLCLGLCAGVVGPTLLDLRQQTQEQTDRISYALSARSAGVVVGSLIVTLFYQRMNFMLAISVAYGLSALLHVSIGFMRQLSYLTVVLVANGMCLGFFDVGANVFLLHMWGKETAPFMQAMQFMFGCGSLVAPLIAEPFLVTREELAVENNATTNAILEQDLNPDDVRLFIPYSIVAAFLVANAIMCFTIFHLYPVTEEHPSRKPDRSRKSSANDLTHKPASNRGWKVLVIILSQIFMHNYLGLVLSFGYYLLTFVVNSNLGLSKATGAHLTSVFWMMITLFRFVAIFLIRIIGNTAVMTICLAAWVVGGGLITVYGEHDETLLWVSVTLIGIGMSSIFGCMFAFLEENFPVTSVIGSLIAVSAIVGQVVFPVIISAYVNDFPQILLWVVFLGAISNAGLFFLIYLVCRFKSLS